MDVSLNAHNHDDFLEQFPIGSFLQGRFWKHFLELQGRKTWQLSVYEKNRLVAHCLLYATNLALGKSYLYAPKGPVMLPSLTNEERLEALELILSQIRDITIATRKREEIFCRIEPNIEPPHSETMPRKQTEAIQPSTTLCVNLTNTPEELLASFKEKTRYNIRLAEKKGIIVRWSNDARALKIFLTQLAKTATRSHIKTHDKKYYLTLLRASQPFDAVFINWAEYQGRPIASNLYILQHNVMTYLHGGFSYRYRNLMAPYLLQWDAIKFAIERGAQLFDFWGFSPRDGSKPHWGGLSRFKRGFEGSIHESPGCFDYVYNPLWYSGYEKMRRLRRLIRL